jgi:hypothetical protein
MPIAWAPTARSSRSRLERSASSASVRAVMSEVATPMPSSPKGETRISTVRSARICDGAVTRTGCRSSMTCCSMRA